MAKAPTTKKPASAVFWGVYKVTLARLEPSTAWAAPPTRPSTRLTRAWLPTLRREASVMLDVHDERQAKAWKVGFAWGIGVGIIAGLVASFVILAIAQRLL